MLFLMKMIRLKLNSKSKSFETFSQRLKLENIDRMLLKSLLAKA